MDGDITPKQTLFLWRLLVQPEGVFIKDAKPDLTSKERSKLVQLGLVHLEKRKPSPKSRSSNFATLSEKGWNWAAKHLDAPLPKTGTAALGILGLLLKRIQAHIETGTLSLSGLISAPVGQSTSDGLETRILGVCRTLAGGNPVGVRVRLAQIKAAAPEVSQAALEALFAEWEKQGRAAFYSFEDPRELTPDDEKAGFPNSLGKPRHLIYFLKA